MSIFLFKSFVYCVLVTKLLISGVSPLGPCSPFAPGTPSFPFSPFGPCGPVSPLSPLGPFKPIGPCEPVSPFSPCGPMSPCKPSGPLGPISPLSPFGPCGPISPLSPFRPLKSVKLFYQRIKHERLLFGNIYATHSSAASIAGSSSTRSNEQILTSDSHGLNPILPQSEQKLLTLIINSPFHHIAKARSTFGNGYSCKLSDFFDEISIFFNTYLIK